MRTAQVVAVGILATLLAVAGCDSNSTTTTDAAGSDVTTSDAKTSDATVADTMGVDVPVAVNNTWNGTGGIKAMLDGYCTKCHGSNISVQFMTSDVLLEQASQSCAGAAIKACIVQRVKAGTMPSGANCSPGGGSAGCPTSAEIARLEAWETAGFPLQ